MKNILIISESYEFGGSGNASKSIFKFFKKKFSTKILIPYSQEKDSSVVNYYNFFTLYIYFFIKAYLRSISYILTNNKFYFFTNVFQRCLFSAKKIKKKLKGFKPDYVLVLWYEYILNYREILKIKDILKANIIIYPFDMHAFTGGCRYVQSCNNYKNSCNNCPAIKLNGVASKNFLSNKKIIREINPLFLFPSSFSLDFANQTKILSNKIKKFKFYYPVIKRSDSGTKKKEFLNYNLISKIKKNYNNIIFFGAQDGEEWRKGIFFFKNTLDIFKNIYPDTYENTMFIYSGNNTDQLFKNPDPNIFIFDFLIYDELVKIYELTDVIAIPSLQEWSSFIMAEAFLLNKYMICFDTGSSKDYIKEGINGNICDPYNFRVTAEKLYNFLNKKNKTKVNFKSLAANINNNNRKVLSNFK
jgi:glycosyltransferase involved in cell wall biosynthesis